jgi:photosystem II stability/assembly factor-like uncharacterized protein
MRTDIQLDAATHDVVWAFIPHDNVLFVSTDQGIQWEQRSLPVESGQWPSVSLISATEGWLMAGGSPETQCNAQQASLWHTRDGARTWQMLATRGIAGAQCKENVSFSDARHGFLDAWDDNHRPIIFHTADGGLTWSGTALPDPHGFVSEGGGFTLRAGFVKSLGGAALVLASGMNARTEALGAYVFRSEDGGVTWTSTQSLVPSQGNVAFVTATRWLTDNCSQETTDAGRTWHSFETDYIDAAGVASDFTFADAQVGYGTVRGDFHRTSDGGAHWAMSPTPWLPGA